MAEETQPFILVSVGFTKLWRRKTKVILNGSMNIEHETKQTPISLEKLIFTLKLKWNIEYLNIVFIFYSLMDPTACLKNL